MITYEDGTILNDAYDGKVIHERNGRFDIEFKLPTNNDKYKLLKKFGVVETSVPYLNEQKFDITSIKKKLGYIEVFANHVGFRLDKNVTKDITSSNVLANTILQRFKASLQKETEFNFMSDITDSRQFNTVGFENALDTLTKGKHSILGQWGGVLVFDNFNIELRKRFGRDTEYLIAKRKNINDLEIDEKSDGVITRLIISKEIEVDEDRELIYATVDSPLIEEYPEVYLRHIETTDEAVETVEDLITYGEDVFRLQKIDLPTESFTIDTTESINNFNFTIDDTALIHYEDYGIDKRVMVTSYEYDPIVERYIKVHFGDKEKSLLQSTTDKVIDRVETEVINPNMTYIDRVFDDIRESLKDPTGGYVIEVKDNEGNVIELLITDNIDLDQAMNIWRWNIQGLSHSSNGINGDFNVAITQGGQMVADFMTAGILNAEVLRAGIIRSANDNVWWDLDTGYININDNIIYDANGFKIKLASGKTIEQELQGLDTRVDSAEQKITPNAITNTFITEFGKDDSRVITKGITRIDKDGVNVGQSGTNVNSRMAYDGFSVYDGEDLITTFGETGAIIPTLQSDMINSDSIINTFAGGEFNIGQGQEYSSVSEVMNTVLHMKKYLTGTVTLKIHGSLSENIYIRGFIGTGRIDIKLQSNAKVFGQIYLRNNSVVITITGLNLSNYGYITTSEYPIVVNNCSRVYMYYMNIKTSSDYGAIATEGSNLDIAACDIVANSATMFAETAAILKSRDNKGNAVNAFRAIGNSAVFATRTTPKPSGDLTYISGGYYWAYSLGSEVDSSFSPPPVTAQTFIRTFTAATFDTLADGQRYNSYYGASACQNRWTGNPYYSVGRIRMGTEIQDFISGGYDISIKMRLRRKNSSHGYSSAIAPTPNFSMGSMSGAVRGGWTGWGVISASLFSGGADLRFGSNTYSNYAIWDAIQVEVTVTKDI